ncbi:hypothetical protein HF313_05105 [Massilia atriviolacea]|uniref:Uncharacterized protein n=1 Tax=Massilia atriviolacea TaxID=2495579 RepID=A0A430HHI4_9BURK|nr:hypothetical protein [Massilia atriviolacea]RSZ56966.1 hypothetical protein EJB06_21810 [Massilia atriviolacea]
MGGPGDQASAGHRHLLERVGSGEESRPRQARLVDHGDESFIAHRAFAAERERLCSGNRDAALVECELDELVAEAEEAADRCFADRIRMLPDLSVHSRTSGKLVAFAFELNRLSGELCHLTSLQGLRSR